jgi:hypothetical protein
VAGTVTSSIATAVATAVATSSTSAASSTSTSASTATLSGCGGERERAVLKVDGDRGKYNSSHGHPERHGSEQLANFHGEPPSWRVRPERLVCLDYSVRDASRSCGRHP